MTLLIFILVLGIIIFSHELGHFIFAKRAGVYIYEFSLGMGPRLFTFHRKNDETDYCIRLLPIGGFVSIAGEDIDPDKKVPKGQNLQDKTWFQRFCVMVAGALFNFILAILILFFVALFTGSVSLDPIIGTVTEGYPAFDAGIRAGDEILTINGKDIFTWDDAQVRMSEKEASKTLSLGIRKEDGTIKNYQLNPKKVLVISDIDHSEIQKGFYITKINNEVVTTSERAQSLFTGKEVTVTVYDGKEEKEYQLTDDHHIKVIEASKYGLGQEIKTEHGFIAAIKYAFQKFASLIVSMFITVGDLLTGKIGLNNMAGPVGIYDIVGDSAAAGLDSIFFLIAYLSINIGFINLIPFPAFDGGKVLFLIIEKLKGSPVDSKIENTIHAIGFVLLMLLMIVITCNDIFR